MAISGNFNSYTEQPAQKRYIEGQLYPPCQAGDTFSYYRVPLQRSTHQVQPQTVFIWTLQQPVGQRMLLYWKQEDYFETVHHKTWQKGLWLDSHKLPISGHFRSSSPASSPQLVRGHQASSSQPASAGTPGLDTEGFQQLQSFGTQKDFFFRIKYFF